MMVTLFGIALIAVACLLICTVYSAYVYRKAMRMYPLKLKKDELIADIRVAQETIRNLQENKKQLTDDLVDMRAQLDQKNEIEEFLENYHIEYDGKKKEIDNLNNEIEEISKKVADWNEQYQQAYERRNEIQNENNKLKYENKELEGDLNIKKQEVENLNKDKRLLESNIAKLEERNLQLEKSVEAIKEEEKKYLKEKVLWDTLQESIKDARTQLDEIREKISQAQQNLDLMEEEKHRIELERNKLRDEQANIRDRIKEENLARNVLEDDIKQLNEEKLRLDADIEKIREAEEQYNQMKESLGSIQQQIVTANDELASYTKRIAAAKLDYAQASASEEIEKQRWEDLDRTILPDTRAVRENVKEIEWLNRFCGNLEDKNIIFNRRTIQAFHTGLKSEDISPLVVLSGISGTGKSLLPQLYSQAIGMNFLQIAVQPRWDSPQDMLGFYNYMQNKFKATELSRLLWQTDIYNNDEVKQRYGNINNLPMNLVLLDEMNLARVEYYFSDLLSKLEVRRNIDTKHLEDAAYRRAAEIEIECGAIGNKGAARRLYINGNTLFVGTMNEDETTQNLSDKVIDRSNVLRFGKPENLQTAPDIEGFNLQYNKDDSYLNYATWSEWCNQKVLDSHYERKLEEITKNLLDSFARVGRPFAHRVWQSIHTYVSSYPGVNTRSGFNNAVADQIEMKLLPKLNGLDLSDSNISNQLRAIETTISMVEDEKLMKAYMSSKDPTTNIFFNWKGVVR